MGQAQAKTIEAAIAELFDEDNEEKELCCTIEAANAAGEDVIVQVMADSLNVLPYPFADDPLARLEESGVLEGLSLELEVVDWDANVYATVGIEGIETEDVARLVDRTFVKLLGCDDETYVPTASTEDLD